VACCYNTRLTYLAPFPFQYRLASAACLLLSRFSRTPTCDRQKDRQWHRATAYHRSWR